MAQFRIKTSKNEVLCPNEMEKHEKKSLFDKCKEENVRLFCNCNGACEYKVRNGNWAIYPCLEFPQFYPQNTIFAPSSINNFQKMSKI